MRLPRHPGWWLGGLILWAAVLYVLSSRSDGPDVPPAIPHFDKIMHFGYFFGGGGLLAGFLYHLNPRKARWGVILTLLFIVVAVLGALDEWHQTFTPGRSGNDPWDWLADIAGGFCGGWVFKWLHPRFK